MDTRLSLYPPTESLGMRLGEHVRTPNIGNLLHCIVFGYLFLAETYPNPPTNQKSMFQHSFPPLHSWSRLRRTNQYNYQWGEHIRTLNIGNLLHWMVFGYLFWLKRIPIHQLTPNVCFNISFHLYIHNLVLDEPIGTLTSGVNTYVPPNIGNLLHCMVFG